MTHREVVSLCDSCLRRFKARGFVEEPCLGFDFCECWYCGNLLGHNHPRGRYPAPQAARLVDLHAILGTLSADEKL